MPVVSSRASCFRMLPLSGCDGFRRWNDPLRFRRRRNFFGALVGTDVYYFSNACIHAQSTRGFLFRERTHPVFGSLKYEQE